MSLELCPIDLHMVKELRKQHAAQMHGPVQAYTESLISTAGALTVGMYTPAGLRGYACYSPEDNRGARTLLEIFVAEGSRREYAAAFLREVIAWVPPTSWEVNSYDRFALSLAVNAGHKLDRTDALLFSPDGVAAPEPSEFRLVQARPEEIEEMRPILMEDGFYTEDWRKLPFEVELGLWHNLRSPGGVLVGIGYYTPIGRSPGYADVGYVVTSRWRRQGHGTRILQNLSAICRERGMQAAAITSYGNTASRRTLERAGFYCDGRIWKVRTKG